MYWDNNVFFFSFSEITCLSIFRCFTFTCMSLEQPALVAMRSSKRHKVSSTEIRYDNLYSGVAEQDLGVRGFRSSRGNRYLFQEQDKREFQDEEDIEGEMAQLKVLSNFKDLSDALELVLFEFEASKEAKKQVKEARRKVKKKVKVKLDYGEDELDDGAEEGGIEVQVKRTESKLKYQRGYVIKRSEQRDPVYKNFIKDEDTLLPDLKVEIPTVPKDYKPDFKIKDLKNAPLNKHTASSLLKSKFTASGSPAPPPLSPTTKSQQTPAQRVTVQIQVDPLVKKRLNIK